MSLTFLCKDRQLVLTFLFPAIIPRKSVSADIRLFMLTAGVSIEDPTILSGTLRSTLDVFNEYQDSEIVHLLFLSSSPCIKSQRYSSKHCAGYI